MPNQKYTFDVYKFLKHITGIANAGNYIKIFPMALLQFKLRNGMLSTKDFLIFASVDICTYLIQMCRIF